MEKLKYNPPSIFELAGKRNPEELKTLIGNVSQILTNESINGRDKLRETIAETRSSTYGNEYFVDGKIAYLPAKGKAVFIGDLHGDSLSTESIIKQTKFFEAMNKAKDSKLIFLGDYSDRGKNDIRNIEIILSLKERHPENIILLRGNHEEHKISERFGLQDSLLRHFPDNEGYDVFNELHYLFGLLPNIVVTGNGIIGVHGGIPADKIENLRTLRENEDIFYQMRWNDPNDNIKDIGSNSRGEKVRSFGSNSFEKFMDSIGARVMVRGHQYPRNGYKLFFDNKLVTVFSNGGESEESAYQKFVQPKILQFYLARPIRQVTPLNILDVEPKIR